MDELPPITLPRGQYSSRSVRCFCAVVVKFQSYGVLNSLLNAAGMWISCLRSGPPASTRATRQSGSAESRFARTQPAEPAPTITKSYIGSSGRIRVDRPYPDLVGLPTLE